MLPVIAPAPSQSSLGAGTIATTRVGTADQGSAVIMETGIVQDRINSIIQFSIDNTGGGHGDNKKVRIGSKAALPDNYLKYGLDAGAADDAAIADQNGVGCLAIQGFSDLVCSKPVIINEIKIFSSDQTQLNQPMRYRSLQLDGTVDELKRNLSWTQEKDDQRDNMVRIKGVFILDVQQFLEFNAKDNKTFDILMKVAGFSNVEMFKPVVD